MSDQSNEIEVLLMDLEYRVQQWEPPSKAELLNLLHRLAKIVATATAGETE